MNRTIDVTYHCGKCKKDLIGKVILKNRLVPFDETEEQRIKNYFLQIHIGREHTFCAGCRKKINTDAEPKENWGIQLTGKSYEKPSGPGDMGLRIHWAIFCKDCIDKIEIERAKAQNV
jgi:hypothetical protein